MNNQKHSDDLPEPPRLEKGRYRHFKGNEYEVVGVGFDSETLAPVVVYKTLYDRPGPEFWVRPYAMFTETVEHEGQQVARFQKIPN